MFFIHKINYLRVAVQVNFGHKITIYGTHVDIVQNCSNFIKQINNLRHLPNQFLARYMHYILLNNKKNGRSGGSASHALLRAE